MKLSRYVFSDSQLILSFLGENSSHETFTKHTYTVRKELRVEEMGVKFNYSADVKKFIEQTFSKIQCSASH